MDTADDHAGAGRVYQSGAVWVAGEGSSSDQ